MKKLFTFLLALVASVGIIYASDTQVDGIWYDFNESNKTATVTHRGSSFSGYDNEYSGSVVIPSSVTYNGTTYSVTSIGDYAFNGCDKLVDVYCYATTPPATGGEDTFSQYNAFLYVPCESKMAYMEDAVWGNFKYIECISSEGIEDVQSDEVQSTKVIKDGQVLILRNGKTYTMQGQEVK